MTQENKELLLRDLSARLQYGVKVTTTNPATEFGVISGISIKGKISVSTKDADIVFDCIEVKPYLRPMSSMTDEEWEELNCIGYIVPLYDGCFGVDIRAYCKNNQPNYRRFSEFSTIEDWFNTHHFDYRGLIPMGLAIEAPKDMYNIKEHNKI